MPIDFFTLVSFGSRFCGRLNEFFYALLKNRPLKHDDVLALIAAHLDISADKSDRPDIVSAGMRLSHLHDITDMQQHPIASFSIIGSEY